MTRRTKSGLKLLNTAIATFAPIAPIGAVRVTKLIVEPSTSTPRRCTAAVPSGHIKPAPNRADVPTSTPAVNEESISPAAMSRTVADLPPQDPLAAPDPPIALFFALVARAWLIIRVDSDQPDG